MTHRSKFLRRKKSKIFSVFTLCAWLVAHVSFTALRTFSAQEPFAGAPPESQQAIDADIVIDDMHVSPDLGRPFSARMLEVYIRGGNAHSKIKFNRMRMVARDSEGRVYYDSARAIHGPGNFGPRTQFFIVDRTAGTRTTCYSETKSCRIDELYVVTVENSSDYGIYPPSFTRTSVSLGESTKNGLRVVGTRETTTFAAGAAGKSPVDSGKEVLRSPELGLDIALKSADPRRGMWAREIQELARKEPNASEFGIPAIYQVFDNRPRRN
jgi:hypothetical protein